MREAIILAGGFGTRLRQVVPDTPKPMARICGKPFLEIILDLLARKGFSRVVMSVGFMADIIINYFGDKFNGIKLVYAVENMPLGTGGAIKLALKQTVSDYVYVFNGDTFLDLEIDEVERLRNQYKSHIIVGREVDDVSRYGKLFATDGKITGFAEKGANGAGIINAGSYIVDKHLFDNFIFNPSFSLEKDFLPKAVKTSSRPYRLFITTGTFVDIGIPEDYAKAGQILESYCV